MSHTVTIKSELRDIVAIRAACKRLSLADPINGKHKLFSSEETGLAVQLPGWNYPVVVDAATGKVASDNYHEQWGKQAELNRFLQAYGICKATIEARKRGYTVSEKTLPDGSIRLTVGGLR